MPEDTQHWERHSLREYYRHGRLEGFSRRMSFFASIIAKIIESDLEKIQSPDQKAREARERSQKIDDWREAIGNDDWR